MDSYTTKLAVRDSLDDDDLSDVDDEVFIRDGKSSSKLVEDRGVKRPLMAPRRKMCKENIRSRHPPCRIKCVFYCYAVVALLILLGLIGLTVLLVSLYPLPIDRIRPYFSSSVTKPLGTNLIRPCTSFRVTNMWNMTFPKRSSESPIRSVDINEDGIKDVILGFQTENGPRPIPYLCPMFFGKQTPCQGGVMALDGNSGTVLWEHWTAYPVYFIDCSADLTGDQIFDCIAMGRGGLLCALDGINGTLIWQFSNKVGSNVLIEFLMGQFIPDQDGDGVIDILVSHTTQKGKFRSGHLVLISGKTGSEIVEIPTPSNRETYFLPQLLKRNVGDTSNKTNGTNDKFSETVSILFGTGGQETAGALYVIPLNGFSSGKKNLVKPTLLYQDKYKGMLTPAVLVDITGDHTDDIIFSTFNGSVIAMDGVNYKQIWNYTFNNSETSAALIPGYFNDDNVTDFMVKFNVGNGFPEYFYSQTLLLDGKTGTDLLHKWVIDSAPSDLAGLSISVQNTGLDLFLYWVGVCKNYEDSSEVYEEFKFVLGNSIWAQSRADICKLRFNSTLILKLYALNQYEEPPGILIYSTENDSEYNKTYSPLNEAKKYLDENPNFEFGINRQSSGEIPVEMYANGAERNLNTDLYPNAKTTANINSGGSSFRHKVTGEGLIRDFSKNEYKVHPHGTPQHIHIDGDENRSGEWLQEQRTPLDWVNDQYPQEDTLDPNLSIPDDNNYDEDMETRRSSGRSYLTQQNRDPRSKDQVEDRKNRRKLQMSKRTDESELPDINEDPTIQKHMKDLSSYDEYSTIQNARNRLLHDLSNVPSDILRQSYLDNAERDLELISDQLLETNKYRNNNKFEQRDLRYRQNAKNQMTSVKKQLENMYDEKHRESLWDLESEKEQNDKAHGYWRGKREMIDNIKHIPKIDSTGNIPKNMFKHRMVMNISTILKFLQSNVDVTEATIRDENMQKILNSDEKFDAIIIHTFLTEGLFPIAHHLGAPLIAFSSVGPSMFTDDLLANPKPYAYVPEIQLGLQSRMTFMERVQNTIFATVMDIMKSILHYPAHEAVRAKYFPNSPDLYTVMKNVSLVLANSHVSISSPRPLMPNLVEIGGFSVPKPKPLPADLKEYLDSAKDGVIYFSLGSNAKSKDMPDEMRNAIVKTFSELKQKVLWKWEEDVLPNQPKNVKIGKWLPQTDILAHPNLKLFITHGGWGSLTESVQRGVPLVGIPIFADQENNMKVVTNRGVGVRLNLDNITYESFSGAVNEVLNNPSYTTTMKEVAKLFNDRERTPMDHAIYWIEYVIRNKGAPHLKSAALELNRAQLLLLDVILFLGSILVAVILIIVCSVKFCYRKCCGQKKHTIKSSKKNN